MTNTLTHTTDVLTQTEARTLARAMQVCRAVERRCSEQGLIHNRGDESAAWFKGRLAETCDRTRDGIFTVLNVASSLCESKHAAGALEWERGAR